MLPLTNNKNYLKHTANPHRTTSNSPVENGPSLTGRSIEPVDSTYANPGVLGDFKGRANARNTNSQRNEEERSHREEQAASIKERRQKEQLEMTLLNALKDIFQNKLGLRNITLAKIEFVEEILTIIDELLSSLQLKIKEKQSYARLYGVVMNNEPSIAKIDDKEIKAAVRKIKEEIIPELTNKDTDELVNVVELIEKIIITNKTDYSTFNLANVQKFIAKYDFNKKTDASGAIDKATK